MGSRSLPNNLKNGAFAGLLDRAQLPIVAAYDDVNRFTSAAPYTGSASWDIAVGVRKTAGRFRNAGRSRSLGLYLTHNGGEWSGGAGLLAKAPSEVRDGASAAQ